MNSSKAWTVAITFPSNVTVSTFFKAGSAIEVHNADCSLDLVFSFYIAVEMEIFIWQRRIAYGT